MRTEQRGSARGIFPKSARIGFVSRVHTTYTGKRFRNPTLIEYNVTIPFGSGTDPQFIITLLASNHPPTPPPTRPRNKGGTFACIGAIVITTIFFSTRQNGYYKKSILIVFSCCIIVTQIISHRISGTFQNFQFVPKSATQKRIFWPGGRLIKTLVQYILTRFQLCQIMGY